MAYIGRDLQYGVLDKQSFTADSSTTAFTLDTAVVNAKSLLVSVGGVIQEPDVAYTASGTTLTFTAAPTTGDVVYVIYLGKELSIGASREGITYQTGTGDDTTTPITLTTAPANAQSIMVMLNGVTQVPDTDYTVSGTTLTFTSTVASGVGILVYHLVNQAEFGVLSDNSVTNPKIVSMDAAKLTGSLPAGMGTDTTAIDQTIASLGMHVAVADNKASFNLPGVFIDQFESDSGILTETDVDRDTTNEYVATQFPSNIIAPSSNDWDYTFSNSAYVTAGNVLGDGTVGGFVDPISVNTAIHSLHTFDGDFVIQWEQNGSNLSAGASGGGYVVFGVHAIDEDDTRAQHAWGGMNSMTNSFWYRGETVADFHIGGTTQSDTHTWTAGSIIKIERVSGTIKFYEDDVLIHTFGTTYSGAVRFCVGGDGGNNLTDMDDIFFTDHSKTQRDGFLNETHSDQSGFGNNQSNADRQGTEFIATRSGSCETLTFNIRTVTTSFNSKCQIWASDGTSPSSQVGGDSDTIALDSTGEKTYTWATNKPTLEKGKKYWWVTIDTSGGSGWVNPQFISGIPWPDTKGTGRHDITTSITQSDAHSRAFELKVNTSDGEPTPGHDTRFLCNVEGLADGSTSFTDSSQIGATITANGNVQVDTAQTLGFGDASILFDGSGDYLSVPSNRLYTIGTGSFTADVIVRFNSSTANKMIMGNRNSSSSSKWVMGTNGSSQLVFSSSTATFITGGTTLSTGVDYHLAVVRAGNQLSIYVNGTSDASTVTNTNDFSDDSVILIGGNDNDGLTDFDGWMKEPRFSTVARWDADYTPPTASYPLVSSGSGDGSTGTLISTASTADAATTTASGVMLYENAVGTATLGTDLKIYFSADDGSNWTEVSSYGTGINFNGASKKLIKLGKTTGLTSGTQMKLKAEWANQASGTKETRLYGWAINY